MIAHELSHGTGAKIWRVPFVLFALVNMLTGILGGLGRIGWTWARFDAMSEHGVIMVGGFLATLILLEKALPLRKTYLLGFVIINALSLLFTFLQEQTLSYACLVIGSLGLQWVYINYLKVHRKEISLWLMLSGAVLLTAGYLLLWSSHFYPQAIPCWIGFILFTIVGERLELSKFLPVSKKNKIILLVLLASYIVSLVLPYHSWGRMLSSLSLILIALWMLTCDVISIGIQRDGLTHYSSIALLCGYIGLLFTGAFMLSASDAALGYDIVLHCFFLGFTFSMIFAHGPIILPGVLGVRIRPYSALLFVPLALLWVSLIIRVSADLFYLPFEFRRMSGWISAGSILLYFFIIVFTALKKKHERI